jgi:diguanylate cyclase (GGDEF)-like protein/PAS domain S-box-containing protein
VSWLRALPAQVRWTFALAVVGLCAAVPFSAPDGTGMQWDELVLTSVGASAAWMIVGRLRSMDREAARPWWPVAVGACMFAVAQLLAGAFPGPAFDGFGADDVVLFLGATSPLVTCGMLARRVSRTRWPALLVDGAVITVSLLVVTEVLRAPLVNPVDAPDDLRSLVLAYGAYAAVMVGGVGALCTVSTSALRRSATTLIGSVVCQASAAGAEAMAIVAPSPAWTAVSDLAVATALLTSALAALRAPDRFEGRGVRATAPVVSPVGIVLVVAAMLSLPLSIALMEMRGLDHSLSAEFGMACVFGLMALRLAMRIKEDGQVTEDLVRHEEDFRELVESSSDGIAIVDDDLNLLFTSPAARRLLGLSGDGDVDLLGLLVPEDRAMVRAGLARTGTGELHFRIQHEDGAPSELEAASSDRPGGGRRVLYLRDVTTRRRRERELERMAYTDHLTALGNRAQLFEEMALPSDDPRCLLVLDMDGFKAVNDVAGHEAGDQLLVEVARRLHTVVRDDDLVARLGGDEFAVLVVGTIDDGEDVAQRVVDTLALPYRTGDYTFAVGASVGVAQLGAAGGQFAFRQADAALRAAKSAGKGCVRLAEGVEVMSSVAALADIEKLTAEGRLRLRLDPAVDPSGRIDVVHAMPVFEHPEHGTVSGQELWAGAERYGISARLQGWLLREACAAVAGLDGVAVAVSLPAGHVTAEGLADDVATTLADSGLEPSRLMLSFTEETLLTAPAALVPELEAARATGVRLCLDNFGMGHSLYAVLARVPLDLVRVDVTALAVRDDLDRALQVLAAIAQSATAFDIQVIAGGIGGPEAFRAAIAAGVVLLHGRHLPHDLTVGDVAALLTAEALPTP